MEKTTNPTDYESIKKQALEQFRSGKSLTGKGGAFDPLLKKFLEAALQYELKMAPSFSIGQKALLVITPTGNIV